jgi:hypothetical protein
MTPPRYRLGLTEPCLKIAPLPDLRPLTVKELDDLAKRLRRAEDALRDYDAAASGILAQIEAIDDPWWPELRPEMLRKGFSPQHLDEEFGSCAGADSWLRMRHMDDPPATRRTPPRWFAPLMTDIVQRVEIAPMAASIAAHIQALAAIDTGKLDASLRVVCVFHPFGTPHQLQIANFAELWGMKPVHRTEGGSTLIGYGEEGPPRKLPWETGEVKARIEQTPPEGPDEDFWQSSYEGLLSWIAELLTVLDDRISTVHETREHLDHLLYEVELNGTATP